MKNINIISGLFMILLVSTQVDACTVFVLNDKESALYFSNENSASSNSRMWFIPGGENFYSAVYIGFGGSAETGMNSEGLAFDWVAQFNDQWDVEPGIRTVRGNYGQRMLEQSANVEEAIDFFRRHPPPSLSRVRPLIADKSGSSVIIGVRDGRLFVERYQGSHGMGTGFGDRKLEGVNDIFPEDKVEKGFDLLERLRQGGNTPTRYSSFFNLKTGEIRIKHQDSPVAVDFRLQKELKLGAHYYVVEDLHKTGKREPRPLEISMHRFPVDVYEPLEAQDPAELGKVKWLIKSLRDGRCTKDCTDRFRQQMAREMDSIRSSFATLGALQSVEIVKVEVKEEKQDYLFRLEFTNALILQRIGLNKLGKIDDMSAEAFEMKGHPEVPDRRYMEN